MSMKGKDLTMKKMDQVDRTVLGTVWIMYPKNIAFDLNNTALQRSTTDMRSFKCLTSCSYQDRFSFFGMGNYITDNPLCDPLGTRFSVDLLF